MKHGTCIALAAAALLAGCGSAKVDPVLGGVELDVNRAAQSVRPRADTPEAASRQLAGLAAAAAHEGGGDWRVAADACKPSGPIISCRIRVIGSRSGQRLTCTASAAVRVKDGQATARRTPYVCEGTARG